MAIKVGVLWSEWKVSEDGLRSFWGSALVMHLDEEAEPWIRTAKEVIVVDNGFENSAAGKPNSLLHRVSVAHCDVDLGFARHGVGAKG